MRHKPTTPSAHAGLMTCLRCERPFTPTNATKLAPVASRACWSPATYL
jgi:hypothetical protein